MKKVLALALTAAMALSMVACGSSEPAAPEVTYKTGLGVVVEVAPTNEDAENEKGASAQVTSTIVAATFDSNDVIVSISVDAAQQKAAFDLEGKAAGEVDLRTKVEKEGDYGMKGVSAIGKEYFEQIEALENWMVGKTVEEIVNMPVMDRGDGSHTHVPTDADLAAGCTITVKSYLDALQEAWDNAVEVEGLAKVGLGQNISVKGTAATADKNGSVQVDTNMVGVALDTVRNLESQMMMRHYKGFLD